MPVLADDELDRVGAPILDDQRNNLLAGLPSADIHAIVSDLVSSRRDVYGDDPRVVIDTEVLRGDGEFRLDVASSYPSTPP